MAGEDGSSEQAPLLPGALLQQQLLLLEQLLLLLLPLPTNQSDNEDE